MNNTYLITSIGWEPRFLLGIKHLFNSSPLPTNLILFHPSSFFKNETNEILNDLLKITTVAKVDVQMQNFDSNSHVETWNKTKDVLSKIDTSYEVALDITTMPRHLILACLHFLEAKKTKVRCIYYPPESYGEWLSSDAGKPKMVFLHSGIAFPDRQTCLVIISGFDAERAQQIVDFFEPKKIILVIQQGDQFENEKRCVTILRARAEIVTACLDTYDETHTLTNQLIKLVNTDVENYNVIAASVGPRCSTLALYELNRHLPSVGLVYASSSQYNKNYSFGINIGAKFESILDFSKAKKPFLIEN